MIKNSEVALIISSVFFSRATDNKIILSFLALCCIFLYVLFLYEEIKHNKKLLLRLKK